MVSVFHLAVQGVSSTLGGLYLLQHLGALRLAHAQDQPQGFGDNRAAVATLARVQVLKPKSL